MPAGVFTPTGFYERNADGTQKLDSNGNPIFHPEKSRYHLVWPTGPDNSSITKTAWFSLATGWNTATGHVWFISSANGKPQYVTDFDINLAVDVREWWELPANVDQISVSLLCASDNPVGWAIEAQAK